MPGRGAGSPQLLPNTRGMTALSVRAPFRSHPPLNLRSGILLLIVFGLVRMALVLQANVTGSYQAVSVVFVAMIALPWVLLTREGRRRIGTVWPAKRRWIVPAALAGVGLALGVHAIASAVWGNTLSPPFAYIDLSYSSVPASPSEDDRLIYLIIFAVIGMLSSPLGEEMLYRGVAHESFAGPFGDRQAALIDAAAFAVTPPGALRPDLRGRCVGIPASAGTVLGGCDVRRLTGVLRLPKTHRLLGRRGGGP